MNQLQETLQATDSMSKAGSTARYVQAAVALALVIVICAFALFIAEATGQENMTQKTTSATTANVLPQLVIWPESLEPNLNGMLATGDGGDVIEVKETGSR